MPPKFPKEGFLRRAYVNYVTFLTRFSVPLIPNTLLQTRTKVLNNELDRTFRKWYPQFRAEAA